MVVREVLKVSLFSTRKEGRDEARKLLEHTPAEILLPVLVPVIGAPAEKVGSKQWWSETSRLRAGE